MLKFITRTPKLLVLLSLLLSSHFAVAQSWQKIETESNPGINWEKLCASEGGTNTWRKLTSCEFVFNYTLGSFYQNFDLSASARASGWDGSRKLVGRVTVPYGAIVYSNTSTLPAFKTGALPAGSDVRLINYGTIVGRGGDGGYQGADTPENGGPALEANSPISLENYGVIAGGGGGGAFQYAGGWGAAGGEGAGWRNGAILEATLGKGTCGGGSSQYRCAYGGNGGTFGFPGESNGTYGVYHRSTTPGAGGASVIGSWNINWAVIGAIRGELR